MCVQSYLFVICHKIICDEEELPYALCEIAAIYLLHEAELPPARENFKLPNLLSQTL